jgi:hypothetical protein
MGKKVSAGSRSQSENRKKQNIFIGINWLSEFCVNQAGNSRKQIAYSTFANALPPIFICFYQRYAKS